MVDWVHGGLAEDLRPRKVDRLAQARIASSILAARGRSPSVLRAALFHQLSVAESLNITDIPSILRLDLAKNDSLSLPADFYHGLLGPKGVKNVD